MRIELCDYYYRKVRCHNKTVDCRLMELGMLGSCQSSLNFDSDIIGGSDSDSFFPLIFSRNKKIMATFDTDLRM